MLKGITVNLYWGCKTGMSSMVLLGERGSNAETFLGFLLLGFPLKMTTDIGTVDEDLRKAVFLRSAAV